MTLHVVHENDKDGNVVDIDYFCSRLCMVEFLTTQFGVSDIDMAGTSRYPFGSVEYGAHPSSVETDYPVYCGTCESLLWKAYKMKTEANEYRLHDPNEHKYDDGFTRYLDENNIENESSGNVDSPTGWFARAGKNVYVCDDRGFVTRDRYPTETLSETLSKAAYGLLERMSTEWDEDEPTEHVEPLSCAIHEGRHHATGSFACELLSQETYYGTD